MEKAILTPNIFNFLQEIKENNTREWFAINKEWYKQIKKECDSFVEELLIRMVKIDKELVFLEVKDCTYRIYRDIRFSTDKTPYKSNIGVFIAKGGKKSQRAGYYLHLEPNNCYLGGGVWMPDPQILKKIRWGIYENIEEFLQIIHKDSFRLFFPSLDNDGVLSRYPNEFPKNFFYKDYLKYKSYTVSLPIKEEQIVKNNFLEYVLTVFTELVPFNQFFNKIIEI